MVLSTQKKITSVVALGLSAVLLFGSTFAWQSLNQEALNYVKGGVNPGGRLHDDFTNITLENDPVTGKPYTAKTFDKDVYVENFTSAADDGVNIYARVRLDEYLEYGKGAGTTGDDNQATSLISGAKLDDKGTWQTFIPNAANDAFRQYWTLSWSEGGSAVYMPTFNKNKDSLLADINGTFEGGYVKYALSEADGSTEKTGHIIQDNDDNDKDELTDQTKLKDLIEKGTSSAYYSDYAQYIQLSDSITHDTAETLTANKSMSMAQWLTATNGGEAYDEAQHGACWVYDTDGWFYWSAPIRPGTATGKLLNQIQRTGKSIGNDGDEWYYGLNVVAQFITADDLGSEENKTGFYNDAKGTAPTDNALLLLRAIGVDVDGSGVALTLLDRDEVEVSDEYELRAALEEGKDVILTEDIELDAPVVVEQNAYVYLNRCTIAPSAEFSGRALFLVSDGAWLDFDDSGVVQAPADGCAVWVEQDSCLYIWDGTFVGGDSAVYVESGEAVIVDGTFYLLEEGGQLIDWCDGDGEITVYRGTFYNFDPSDVHGESLLEDGYTVEVETYGGDTIYTATVDLYEPLPDEELPTEGENRDELPGDATEGGDTAVDDVSGENVDGDKGTSTDAAGDVTDVPEASAPGVSDSSVIESTENGAVSGISGKADVVEPEVPTGDATEAGTADSTSSTDDTAVGVTDEETVG